jgi:RNA recognition motif-containing protein
MLKRAVPEDVKGKIKGLKVFKSMDGCVFDFPEDSHKLFEEIIFNDKFHGVNYTLAKAEILPELLESENVYGGNNSFGNRGGNSFGGNSFAGSNSNGNYGNRSTGNASRGNKMDIFIGNLSSGANEKTIYDFLQTNNIDINNCEIKLKTDRESGAFKGFAFLTCYDENKYNNILKLTGRMINGRAVRINDANNK